MAESASYHVVITLSGVAEALPTGVWGPKVRWVSLQPGEANANPIYLGGAAVSAISYGTRLPVASGGIPPPPHVIGEFQDGALRLASLYVLGTAGEKLHLHILSYEGASATR